MPRVDCRRWGKVKREPLEFLLENALHTEHFARYVGHCCRIGPSKDISREMNFDAQTVRRLEMRYMRAQLERVPKPSPQALWIDEISIRKGHVYRIVVSDLHRQRWIWFGGEERSEQSMDGFYQLLRGKEGPQGLSCGDGHVEARSATPPPGMHLRRRSGSTRCTSCDTSATRSTRCANRSTSDVAGEALGMQRVLQQELLRLALHLPPPTAVDPRHVQVQVYPVQTAGQIPNPSPRAVVPVSVNCATRTAHRFFPRRTSVTSHACGSLNRPCRVALARKPGKVYASTR